MPNDHNGILRSLLDPRQGQSLAHIQKLVTDLWSHGAVFHPYYTLHGPQHAARVEAIIGDILAPEHNRRSVNGILTLDELFYLLASAWLHDVGMITPLSQAEEEEVVRAGISREDYVRQEHHTRSREYVEAHWKELLFNSHEEASFIGAVCQAHRGPNLGSDERLKVEYPNLRLLGAILRIADELDITKDRAPESLLEIRWNDMDERSKWHWLKHRCMRQAKARHLKLLEEPPVLMLAYHYTIQLPNHKFAEPFWERVIRPVREAIDYSGIEDILRQKHISVDHRFFTKHVVLDNDKLPDGKTLDDYLSKFLKPPELISRELEATLGRISWENPAVATMLRAQCKTVLDLASSLRSPHRIDDAVARFVDKLSSATTQAQIEVARDVFRNVIRDARSSSTDLLGELSTEAYKLADLGWRLTAYVCSEAGDDTRMAHIRHLCGWMLHDSHRIIEWIVRYDPSPSLRKYAVQILAECKDDHYDAIVGRARDDSPEVRLEVVKALASLHGPQVRTLLQHMSDQDPVSEIRKLAEEILRRL